MGFKCVKLVDPFIATAQFFSTVVRFIYKNHGLIGIKKIFIHLRDIIAF